MPAAFDTDAGDLTAAARNVHPSNTGIRKARKINDCTAPSNALVRLAEKMIVLTAS